MSLDIVELLSPTLIERYPKTVQNIDRLCSSLWKEIGWHYILDLVWILKQLDNLRLPRGTKIVDGGAGKGILQFLLANRGYNVISVDFTTRRIPLLPSLAFTIYKIKEKSRPFEHHYLNHLAKVRSLRNKISRLPIKIIRNRFTPHSLISMSASKIFGWRKIGWIQFYQADMRNMNKIKTGSIGAVVSLSAIEHMERDDIPDAVKEFNRILKPGASMLITTSTAREKDCFHEPSKGWCFSESSLRGLFEIVPKTSFDTLEYDKLLEQFRASQELKRRLASLYFTSGNNGMPWGKWDPKYLPVGILKAKYAT